MDGLGWLEDGPDVVGNGWDVMVEGLMLLGGGIFSIFLGFAIDRSKKYIKTIKHHMKIDAVDPQAAANNHPPPPGHNGWVYGPLQPPKPRQIVRCLGMLTHAQSYFNLPSGIH